MILDGILAVLPESHDVVRIPLAIYELGLTIRTIASEFVLDLKAFGASQGFS